jgi:ubiquinone biosynthesis protein COQ4
MIQSWDLGRSVAHTRGLVAFVRFVRDTDRLPEVFRMAEGLATKPRLAAVVRSARASQQGADAISKRTALGRVDLHALRLLPETTLGYAYSEHMHRNGLCADAIESVAGVSDADYVRNHLRETHDLWHTVLGFDTSIAGELGVQAFYLAQIPTHLSLAILGGGVLNCIESGLSHVEPRMTAITRGWAMGKHAAPLFGLAWNTLWERDLAALRTELVLS